jgi:hypothetical protein
VDIHRSVHANVHSPGQRLVISLVPAPRPGDARAVIGRRSRDADVSASCLDCSDGHKETQWTKPGGTPAGLLAHMALVPLEGRQNGFWSTDAVATHCQCKCVMRIWDRSFDLVAVLRGGPHGCGRTAWEL